MDESLPGEADLWLLYKKRNDTAARDRLVAHYQSWASGIAGGIHRRLGAYQVDREDFTHNALIGMLEAMNRFDPDRGIPFPAYAASRVRGAVFNGIRTIIHDRPPPSINKSGYRLSEMDDDNEKDPFLLLLDAVTSLGVSYLLDETLSTIGMRAQPDAYAFASQRQMAERLLMAVNRLPDRLRGVVEAHYYKEKKFTDIAQELGVTKGRVSQLHKEALNTLKGDLRKFSSCG
ncbi:sigma-70 family RNA polymerase sigma factor [Solilutibacter pythonis]|nr:sigma-70 family RNA polymerase sigma factor [Lysobacter pythonis]